MKRLPAENQNIRIVKVFQCLAEKVRIFWLTWTGGEGSTSGPSPPPLAREELFSRRGLCRIFPLFSRVMRYGQLTGPGAKSLGSSLSGPIFSGPINRARFGSERHATEIIRVRVGAHWAGFAVPFAKPLEPGSNDQRTA